MTNTTLLDASPPRQCFWCNFADSNILMLPMWNASQLSPLPGDLAVVHEPSAAAFEAVWSAFEQEATKLDLVLAHTPDKMPIHHRQVRKHCMTAATLAGTVAVALCMTAERVAHTPIAQAAIR